MRLLFYPFLVLLDLSFSLFCLLLVNWWAPLFATADARLPRWLAWVDTFDADLDTGNREFGWHQGYWGRVLWLNRNHAYGFSYWLLGMPFDPSQWQVKRYLPTETGRFTFYATGPGGTFNWHAVRYGLRFKFGWKAWNLYDETNGTWDTRPWGPVWRLPLVFSISRA